MNAIDRPILLPLDRTFREEVRARLRQTAQDNGLDGHLLCKPANVAYASGYHFIISERPVVLWVPVDGEEILFVPTLEVENAAMAGIADVRCYGEYPGSVQPLIWMLDQIGRQSISVDFLDALLLPAARDRTRHLFLRDFAMEQRIVKTPQELALLQGAARYADMALERLLQAGADILSQGGTEYDLISDATGHARARLMADHREAFARLPLEITASLHSGIRSSLPHGALTNHVPQPGEVLVAAIGAQLGGYHAQSGATFTVGEASVEQRRLLELVAATSAAAMDAARPGATGEDVNAAAIRVVEGAGLSDAIRHRTGHSMGVEGHEPPWIASGDRTPLTPGMVMTCSPGIYRPGRDGYRMIDTMIITEGRPDIASRFLARTPVEQRVLAV